MNNPENDFVASAEELSELTSYYRESVHDVVERYFGTLESNFCERTMPFESLVGLITFPNSGTSWFLHMAREVTGIALFTVYWQESQDYGGRPSRGVFLLEEHGGREPTIEEPAIVKSHVDRFMYFDGAEVDVDNFREIAAHWALRLPPGSERFIRLVRNPFDNLRARYHLYVKQHRGSAGYEDLSFREFYRKDLKRYLLWHACCNQVARSQPLMTVMYGDLLANPRFEFRRAMEFAGYRVDPDLIGRALSQFRPKYIEREGVPTHLRYYTREDLEWISEKIREWTETRWDLAWAGKAS